MKEVWDDFGSATRKLFGGMWLVGFSLLIICSIADIAHASWLQNRPFIPNVLAGLVGFLIGVPVALVGLATITTQREEKAARDRVQAMAQLAWNQFRDAVYEISNEERLSTFRSVAEMIVQHHNEARERLLSYRELTSPTNEDHRHLQFFIEYSKGTWRPSMMQMDNQIGTKKNLGPRWHAIVRDWLTLDQYVRLQCLEQRLLWFDRPLDSQLQQIVNADLHPMKRFFETHEGPRGSSHCMWEAYDILDRFYELPHEEVFRYDSSSYGHFPGMAIYGYMEAVDHSIENLRTLRNIVERIDQSNWVMDQPNSL